MAIAIDIPWREPQTEHGIEVQEGCQRLRASGEVCGMPVEAGSKECARHERWFSLVPAVFGMPYPEDAVSVQEILARAVSMVVRREMSPEHAKAVAMLCREMRQNLAAYEREMERVWPRRRSWRRV
jgi:hypothetical protein